MTKAAKLPYALNVSGEIVSVKDVPKGLACECTCPACGARLVAKQGAEQVWHFSHYHVENCQAGYESALHLAVKAIIEQEPRIFLPPCFVVRYDNDRVSPNWADKNATRSGVYEYLADRNAAVWARDLASVYARGIADRPGRMTEFDRVAVEIPDGNIRPDLVAFAGDRPINIEVAVTHFIDREKLSRIRARGVPTIEIVVPPSTDPDWQTLRQLLHGGNGTFWRYHPLAEQMAEADYHARLAAKTERERTEALQKERRLAAEAERERREALRKERARELREKKFKLIAEARLKRRSDRFYVRWNRSNVNLSVYPYTEAGAKEATRIAHGMAGTFNRQMRQWEFPAERSLFVQLVKSLRSAGAEVFWHDLPEGMDDEAAFQAIGFSGGVANAQQEPVASGQVTPADCSEGDRTLCAIEYRYPHQRLQVRLGSKRLYVQVIPAYYEDAIVRRVVDLCAGNEGVYDPQRVAQFEFPSDDELFFKVARALKVPLTQISSVSPPDGLSSNEFLREIGYKNPEWPEDSTHESPW